MIAKRFFSPLLLHIFTLTTFFFQPVRLLFLPQGLSLLLFILFSISNLVEVSTHLLAVFLSLLFFFFFISFVFFTSFRPLQHQTYPKQ